MATKRSYRFKILPEATPSVDGYAENTHDRIADSLIEIITTNLEGCAIGLQGEWGAGKSTVISIFKRKIEDEDSLYKVFYFDAWSHEGDPLRQIFLQEMIKTIGDDDLKDIEEKVSKKKKTINTTVTRGITGYGLWFSLASLLIPLGLFVLNKTELDLITLRGSYGDIYWRFVIGILFTTLPLHVTWIHVIYLLCFKKIKYNLLKENFHFLNKIGKETIKQDIDDEYDRSSIDFQKYFNEILNHYFNGKPDNRLIIVIDNLDRIDESDALKIWATLQTYLPSYLQTAHNENYKKLWTIIPYAESGIARLWNDNQKEDQSKDKEPTRSFSDNQKLPTYQSFLEKSLQIRINVPKPILSTWETYAREQIENAFVGWIKSDKDIVLSIFKHTATSITNVPTPRQIKSYLNQVGATRITCHGAIETSTIAYYVVQKHIKRLEDRVIIKEINEADKQPSVLLSVDYKKQMASLIYGVDPDIAFQIMMLPLVQDALIAESTDEINKIYENNKTTFKPILDYYFGEIILLQDLIQTSLAFVNWSNFSDFENLFLSSIRRILNISKDPTIVTDNNINYTITFCKWINEKDTPLSKKIWSILLQCTTNYLQSEPEYQSFEHYKEFQKLIMTALIESNSLEIVEKVNNEWQVEALSIWGEADYTMRTGIHKIIVPNTIKQSEINRLYETIKETKSPSKIYYLIYYRLKSDKETNTTAASKLIGKILSNLRNTIEIEELYSDVVFTILLELEIRETINQPASLQEEIFQSSWFWSDLEKISKEDDLRKWKIALLTAKYHKTDIQTDTLLHDLELTWKDPSEDIAKDMWYYIKQLDDIDFYWRLAESTDRALVSKIMTLALKDSKEHHLFKGNVSLNRFKIALDHFKVMKKQVGDVERLINRFESDPSLPKMIADTNLDALIPYSREIEYLLNANSSIIVHQTLKEKLSEASQEQWTSIILDHPNWQTVLVKINTPEFAFNDEYLPAILNVLEKWAGNEIETDQLSNSNWKSFVFLLSNEDLLTFKRHIIEQIFERVFSVSQQFIEYHKTWFEKDIINKAWTQRKSMALNTLLASTEEEFGDFEKLYVLEKIMLYVDGRKLRIPKEQNETLKKNLSKLYNIFIQIDYERTLIERISKIFNIRLLNPNNINVSTPLKSNNILAFVTHDPICKHLHKEINKLNSNTIQYNPSIDYYGYQVIKKILSRHKLLTIEDIKNALITHRTRLLSFHRAKNKNTPRLNIWYPIQLLNDYLDHEKQNG